MLMPRSSARRSAGLAIFLLTAAAAVAAVVLPPPRTAPAGEPQPMQASAIMVAGQLFEVGRPVVLWKDPQGFDAYQIRCIDQRGGCCDSDSKRYGSRKGLARESVEDLQQVISQLV